MEEGGGRADEATEKHQIRLFEGGRFTSARSAQKDPVAQQLPYRTTLRALLGKIQFELQHLGLEVSKAFQALKDHQRIIKQRAFLLGAAVDIFNDDALRLGDRAAGLRVMKADGLPFLGFQNGLGNR